MSACDPRSPRSSSPRTVRRRSQTGKGSPERVTGHQSAGTLPSLTIGVLTRDDAPAAARLHTRSFPDDLFTLAGERVLIRLFEEFADEVTLAAKLEGRLVGYSVGTLDKSRFMRRMVRRHMPTVAAGVALAILRRPYETPGYVRGLVRWMVRPRAPSRSALAVSMYEAISKDARTHRVPPLFFLQLHAAWIVHAERLGAQEIEGQVTDERMLAALSRLGYRLDRTVGVSDRIAAPQRRAEVVRAGLRAPSWNLTERQLCDLELLLNGGFMPLTGFMNGLDYESVCQDMRLANGALWPIPIVLDVTEEAAKDLTPGTVLGLRDPEGALLAVLYVEDLYRPDRKAEARQVYLTGSREHPGVAFLLDQTHPVYVGGTVEGVHLPSHFDFPELRMTPRQVRAAMARQGWARVVGFQTRNPIHRVHQELTLRAGDAVGAKLLINPVVGMTKPGDIDHYTRVRCYKALMHRYPEDTAMLALLPLAMRMAGPREALWHAIVRRNL